MFTGKKFQVVANKIGFAAGLLAFCIFAFQIGRVWESYSPKNTYQFPIAKHQIDKLDIAKCTPIRNKLHDIPETTLPLLSDSIEILRMDANKASVMLIESDILNHSFHFDWTLESWPASIPKLATSVAYLARTIEGQDYFEPLALSKPDERSVIAVPDIESSGRIIALGGPSTSAPMSDDCRHFIKTGRR